MERIFDAVIIGAGQAGPPLAERLSGAGWKVAFIEKDQLGGTCVNRGCTPTKAMVASAKAAYTAAQGSEFGLVNGEAVRVDLMRVKARKDAIVAQSRSGLESWIEKMNGCTLLHGTARFDGPRRVRVGDELLSSEHIFLNVGARPKIPEMAGIDKVPYLTSTTILELDAIPQHLIMVGGSYVGLEFAQMFRRFGSEVTVVERSATLLNHEDADVSESVRQILEAEGIRFRLQAECIRLDHGPEGVLVHVDCNEGSPDVHGSHVLLAMGRQPNTDDLGLESAGLSANSHGVIEVDDQLRTSVKGIWALGDCNGRGGFTHTSYNDFEIVAANLLDNGSRRVSDRIPVHALYIDPPLAQVGMNEREVRKRGMPALMGIRPMTRVSRAVEKGETKGFMKVLVDAASQEILGATILGVGGDEAIHCILTAMYAKQPAALLQHSVHIHPTVAELIPTVFQSLKPIAI
jgi:pyruvate/2-oxoglutarate dehydrogenase complex dihydrolipoamide dehydrogenase (E3) component